MTPARAAAVAHPIAFASAATFCLLAVVVAGNVLGGARDDPGGVTISLLARVLAGLLACGVAAGLGWTESGFAWPRHWRTWLLFAPPLAYLGVTYPLLFTGSLAPNPERPALTALVGAASFAAGATEDLIFRGLVLLVLLAAGQRRPHVVMRAAIVSSLFFSLPHLLNLLAGDQLLRVLAQNLWAFLLGLGFALLVRTAGSVWPAAVLHGGVDAIVHMNRM